ncbi:mitoferrin-1 [Nasonia vitripennis]|uniref:Mitoferrin n=1 Tax=Nasonia vitripennis TaxID=7425 RepID=A0A7M7H3X8_NASVI|nr:mitoferrin-1 [Nasonia vitripennis]XP_008203068.1 mitoferrin-1 [Nasonia vitripennis]XP_016841702.1 mitoferrin-1 [Nasonia vitripennis]
MNADDYESLPTQSVGVHMMAGACAGVMEHCVMYSVDSVKTRRQMLTPGPGGGGGILTELSNMIRQEGVFRPFRGISAMVVGAGPAHALYFSCYEYLKEQMMSTTVFSHNHHLVYAYAGVVSTVLHDGVMNPAEVVKQRMQMANSPYRTVLSCIRRIYATEGITAFYRSYRTTLLMNVPFQSIHFVTYEFTQSITNPHRTYDPTAHVVSGAMAGAVAATVSMPLDVCKTLLNTQTGEVRATGMVHALGLVYRYWGFPGYFRGLSARIVYQMPATAICWSTYEFFKYLLRDNTKLAVEAIDNEPCGVVQNQRNIASNPSNMSNNAGSGSFQGAGLYFNNKPSTPVLFDVTRS